eukprot:NODE_2320_length_1615_cov_71.250670_g1991_i0.p1 GENE.NODE_2320_length_1615_cov_71.250670_g1991_i0~~NODE_2320_length_1615_cov_71.250670_g1991_i0.p1  ORF type:complete len:391 (-),score=72.62 NODE_2320_length_1615_cov_71.250670_g1991_i0:211-1383(-)
MYFDSKKRPVRLNRVKAANNFQALCPHMAFDGPYELNKEAVQYIDEKQWWNDVNLFKTAKKYCWIPTHLEKDEDAELFKVPMTFGGFAYECKDGTYVFFAVKRNKNNDVSRNLHKTRLIEKYVSMIAANGLSPLKVPKATSKDGLIIVDMQNDFLPGGGFGVAEGDIAAIDVCRLIDYFTDVGAKIVATRDYHPRDHVSFSVFPPHCIEGSVGSHLYSSVASAMQESYGVNKERTHVVFKGFHSDIDSFGCFPYSEEYGNTRLTRRNGCSLDFTGCIQLRCSNLIEDINAPPDIIVSSIKEEGKSLKDLLFDVDRLFVCGLALDFCVLDTALNASALGFDKVYIVMEASRAAYLPEIGKFDGFLTDPKEFVQKCRSARVQLVDTESLIDS